MSKSVKNPARWIEHANTMLKGETPDSRSSVTAQVPEPRTATSHVPASVVLRGRTAEMVTALGKLRAIARGGHGQILIVTGDRGLGKSALADEITAEARVLGFRTCQGCAGATGDQAPGATLLDSLRQGPRPLLSTAELTDLAAQADEPLLILESVADRLESAAVAEPLLILLDDLDRADQLTRFLLRTLPFRLASLPILWLLVGRAAHNNALNDLSTLSGSRANQIAVARQDLEPLPAEAVISIAHDRLGPAVPAEVVKSLHRSGGNPLMALQILDTFAAAHQHSDDRRPGWPVPKESV